MSSDWREAIDLRSPTEERSPRTEQIDTLDSAGIVSLILAEDAGVVDAVRAEADGIAALADMAVAALLAGGQIQYVGAGTSGRLAVLDAAELRPTYGLTDEEFVGHLAGGPGAMTAAVEGAEDDAEAGARLPVGPHDLVIGLAASGRTPYVGGALRAARAAGAATGLIAANPHAPLAAHADVSVLVNAGPEVITGSTRMRAGTAQKLVLNTFSTAVMVRLGKTYSNLMITVQPTNVKLRARCVRMLVQATGADAETCAAVLDEAGQVRVALVALLARSDVPTAAAAAAENPPDARRTGDPGGIRTAVASLT